MQLTRTNRIIIQIVLTLFYAFFLYAFLYDVIGAIDNPESRWAIYTGDETLKSYLIGNFVMVAYFVLGIVLLFWKTKHRKWWVMLHISPTVVLIIYDIVISCFFPEQLD